MNLCSTERAPRTLAEVLEPIAPEEFVQNYLGKTFHFFPGRAGKFAALLPWSDLNQILSHHQLDIPRLRLVRDGKPIPPESFISYHTSRRHPLSRITRLRSNELTRHLQEGATLILDAVDEIHERITELAENLERNLRARIQVNMYAGWRASPGFDVHWDGHDVLILQVYGRKHWKVYPMTREYPLPDDPKAEEPPKNPLWEGTLEDGDLLYIPRGWWHVALALNAPTLHLTVGIHRAVGADFLSWFASRLRVNAAVREDLPRLGTVGERETSLQRIRAAWEQTWHPGLLDEYFAYLDIQTNSRSRFDLPWSAEPAVLPAGQAGWSVKWLAPSPIEWNPGGQDMVVVRCNRRELKFAAAARPVLEALQGKGTCSMEELYEGAAAPLTRERLRIFIKELVNVGLVSIVVSSTPL